MSEQTIKNGYYGKVSTHGDFVSRGLSSSFIDPWDGWLQEAVFSSRQQLGDNWINCYLTGPIYRFALSPGVCGENGWLGIMMPSVDSVGRYYPMAIVTMNRENINPFYAVQREEKWFSAVEELALSTLADNFNLQQFNDDLDALQTGVFLDDDGDTTQIPFEHANKQNTQNAWQKSVSVEQKITETFPAFFNDFLKEHYFSYSLWWTKGSELVEPSLLICQGMPPFDGVAAMLDGECGKWGWEGNRYPFDQ